MADIERLARDLELNFSDLQLLQTALTHKSHPGTSYERMEFLGDAVLDLVVSEYLYKRFPDSWEGELSRMRSAVVNKQTLATVARELDLATYVKLGEGELKSGGFNRDSILADLVESIICATYLDQGMAAASELIDRILGVRLSDLSSTSGYKDAKSRLQEYLQEMGQKLPVYKVLSTSGEQHEQVFTVCCRLPDAGKEYTESGASRRKAEQAAAAAALTALGV